MVFIVDSLLLQNCTFEENETDIASAVQLFIVTIARIHNCTFKNNTSYSLGGAISQTMNPVLSITDSLFISNKAAKGYGGAISISNY